MAEGEVVPQSKEYNDLERQTTPAAVIENKSVSADLANPHPVQNPSGKVTRHHTKQGTCKLECVACDAVAHSQQEPVPACEGRRTTLPALLPSQDLSAAKGREVVSHGARESGAGGGGRGAPKARPDAAAAPASSRLDTGTICDQGERKPRDEAFRVLLRNYGEGLVEATVTINRPPKRKRVTRDAPSHPNSEQKEENKQRAMRRARTAVRQSIMAAQLDHLLTLTYRENQMDPVLAWKHFARFRRLLRKHRRGRTFPYVAVLERQKRGAIHVHAAVSGYQDVRLLRVLWNEAIGDFEGNIDVKFFRQRLPTLARYLTKYITKDIGADHCEGDHRYKRSRGIVVPAVLVLLPYTAAVDEELLRLFDTHGAVVAFHKNQLEDGAPKWLWACSW